MTDSTQQQSGSPTAPPANAAEARTRIDGLIKDREFGARLVAGDADANLVFRELQLKADTPDPSAKVTRAMSVADLGVLPDSSIVQMGHIAGMLPYADFN